MLICCQDLQSSREESSGELDDLRAQLASTKESLEEEIQNKEQVTFTLTLAGSRIKFLFLTSMRNASNNKIDGNNDNDNDNDNKIIIIINK